MENEDQSEGIDNPFKFLELDEVQKYFADLNIDLLRGRHIQKSDYYLFQLGNTYIEELTYFYKTLYQLDFVRDKRDGEFYFYLNPPEDGKGKIADPSRCRELSEESTIIGIMLLSMYYDRYFSSTKEITWEDLQKEIEEGDYSIQYKRMLFNDVRKDYSDVEWENVKKLFRKTLREFQRLGWVERVSSEEGERIHFIIRESIHRLAKLYDTEINNFEQFAENHPLQKK